MPDPNPLIAAAKAAIQQSSPQKMKATLRQPVIIVSAPRSGNYMLFEQLSKVAGFWTIGGESHGIYQAFPGLRAENSNMDSGGLGKSHADPETRMLMRACFLCLLRDHRGFPYMDFSPDHRPPSVTLLEKTPRNALNIPFLLEVFPHARFIYLHRDPRQNIASIIEAWNYGLQTGRFTTFRDLPGWDRPAWCFLLPPGWRSMIGKSLPEIAAFQWSASNAKILDSLTHLPSSRWVSVSYHELTEAPGETLTSLCQFAGLKVPPGMVEGDTLPLSRTTLSPPHPDKWKKYEQEINKRLPEISGTADRIKALG